jgi:glutathione-regulated potassium-efflux system protein KefB
MDLCIDWPVRETVYSSLKMTRKALEALGLSAQEATDQVERFRRQDAELIKAQYLVYDDETKLVQTTREALADLARLFEADASPEAARARERDAGTPLSEEE